MKKKTQEELRQERKRLEIEMEVIKMAKENPYPTFLVGNGDSQKFWKLVNQLNPNKEQ